MLIFTGMPNFNLIPVVCQFEVLKKNYIYMERETGSEFRKIKARSRVAEKRVEIVGECLLLKLIV